MYTFFLSLFWETERERERERERAGDGGGEREGERESQERDREPDTGLEPTNHEIMTWAKIKRQTLNRLSHPGTLRQCTLLITTLTATIPFSPYYSNKMPQVSARHRATSQRLQFPASLTTGYGHKSKFSQPIWAEVTSVTSGTHISDEAACCPFLPASSYRCSPTPLTMPEVGAGHYALL